MSAQRCRRSSSPPRRFFSRARVNRQVAPNVAEDRHCGKSLAALLRRDRKRRAACREEWDGGLAKGNASPFPFRAKMRLEPIIHSVQRRWEHRLATERVERKLAASFAAGVAGYARLIGTDKEGTRKRRTRLRGAAVAVSGFATVGIWALALWAWLGENSSTTSIPAQGPVSSRAADRSTQASSAPQSLPVSGTAADRGYPNTTGTANLTRRQRGRRQG